MTEGIEGIGIKYYYCNMCRRKTKHHLIRIGEETRDNEGKETGRWTTWYNCSVQNCSETRLGEDYDPKAQMELFRGRDRPKGRDEKDTRDPDIEAIVVHCKRGL